MQTTTTDILITTICFGVLALMFAVTRTLSAPAPVDAHFREKSIEPASADEAAMFERVWSEVQQPILSVRHEAGESTASGSQIVVVTTGYWSGPLSAWGHWVRLQRDENHKWHVLSAVSYIS